MAAPNRRLAIVAAAAALAAPAEGLRQWAYRDPPGILTVCRGHTGPDVDPNRKYSIAECDALLNKDMTKAVDDFLRCVPDAPDSVAIAFSDAVFNLGPTIACDKNNSTAARLLGTKSWRQACEQLPRWNKARVLGVLIELPGLTTRRGKEQTVCLSGLA